MRVTILIIAVLAVAIFAQTQMAPSVTDNGGGVATGDSVKILSSIGQSVTGIRTNTTTLQTGYITDAIGVAEIIEHPGKPPVSPVIGSFFPNPFNSSASIEIGMPQAGEIELKVFDISGKQIYAWNTNATAGNYSLVFRPDDELPSGTFFFAITACNKKHTGKLVLVR